MSRVPEPEGIGDVGTTRRRFLRVAGGGGALVLAGAAGFLDYRAITQGVFGSEEGEAYTAWDEWDAGAGPMTMVAAAVLAANAHDSQPWLFGVSESAIELRADPQRGLGTVDPLLREMHVSLGCALENCALAAPASGFAARTVVTPAGEPGVVARVELEAGDRASSELFGAIPDRHTDRGGFEERELGAEVLDAVSALNDVGDIDIVWFDQDPDKQAFADLTVRATEAFIGDSEQTADDYEWFRTSRTEIEDLKDGITTDAAGLSPLIRALAKIAPAQTQDQVNNAWLKATKDTQVPSAAAFAVIVARDREDRRQQVESGRLYQRMHLWAIAQGLGMQPLCQTTERIDREKSSGQQQEITDRMAMLLPAGWGAVMPFRIGYSSNETLRSPRRPASEVLVSR